MQYRRHGPVTYVRVRVRVRARVRAPRNAPASLADGRHSTGIMEPTASMRQAKPRPGVFGRSKSGQVGNGVSGKRRKWETA